MQTPEKHQVVALELVRASPQRALLEFVVSFAAAASGGAKYEQPGKRRRFEIVKGAIACSCVVLLLYFGYQGRQLARLQARLSAVLVVRDQLQQKLEEERRPIGPVLDPGRGTNANAREALSPGPEAQAFVRALSTELAQFEWEYVPGHLPEPESLELRLSKATLANAETRFANALAMLTAADEQGEKAGAAARIGRRTDVLEIRGDSFYGLHQWRDALDRYQQILKLEPNRVTIQARVAECQTELGRRDEALATYSGLAMIFKARAEARFAQGKVKAALSELEQGLDLCGWLVEQQGQKALAPEFTNMLELRSRLELNQSARPYRVPLSTADRPGAGVSSNSHGPLKSR